VAKIAVRGCIHGRGYVFGKATVSDAIRVGYILCLCNLKINTVYMDDN